METGSYGWERLERAVGALVAEQQRLREALGARDQRVRQLESELLEANQRRQDTAKRIDELIAQLDALDAQLDAGEPES